MIDFLVFGAAGQLGQALTALGVDRGLSVVPLSHREVDITHEVEVEQVVATVRPRFVVNAAAYTAVDRAETEPELAMKVNGIGAGIVARAAARNGAPLVHISTDHVFDGNAQSAYREDDAVNPLNTYGRSKADGEERVRHMCAEHVVIRTAWVYGAAGTNFVRTVLSAADRQSELRVVTDQYGSPTSAGDLAEAIVRAIVLAPTRRAWGTYHFAGDANVSRFEWARTILEMRAERFGDGPVLVPIPTAEYPTQARRPLRAALESSKFARVFGYRSPAWRESLRRVVASILAGHPRAMEPAA